MRSMFTGISIIYFLVLAFLSSFFLAKYTFILSSPHYFVEEATESSAMKIAKVCSGFSTEETLPPPPAGGYYVVGTLGDVSQQTVINLINYARMGAGFVDLLSPAVSRLRKAFGEAAADIKKTEEFAIEVDNLLDVMDMADDATKLTDEYKIARQAAEELQDQAGELKNIDDEIKATREPEKKEELLRKRRETIQKIQENLGILQKYLNNAEAGRKVVDLAELFEKIKRWEELSEMEKLRAVSQLVERVGDKAEEVEEVSKGLKLVEEIGEENYILREMGEMESVTPEELDDMWDSFKESLEKLSKTPDAKDAALMRNLEVSALSSSVGLETKYLELAKVGENAIESAKEGRLWRFSSIVGKVKNMEDSSRLSRLSLSRIARDLPLLVPLHIVLDNIDTWSLGFYERLSHYWLLLLYLRGYVYYYAPSTFIFVNSTSPEFKNISMESVRLVGELHKLQEEFTREAADMAGNAGLFNFKEALITAENQETILQYTEEGKIRFSPRLAALLLLDYLSETCNVCDCYSNMEEVERGISLLQRALAGERIDPEEIPAIPGCEPKAGAVREIFRIAAQYEDQGNAIMEEMIEKVILPTKELLHQCGTFSITFGDIEIPFSKCGVVVDCSLSPNICYLGAPITSEFGLYLPIDTISPHHVADLTQRLGEYYSPAARIRKSTVPSPTGIVICTEARGIRACRTVECGKPITYRFTPDLFARVKYEPESNSVVVYGNIMPWH